MPVAYTSPRPERPEGRAASATSARTAAARSDVPAPRRRAEDPAREATRAHIDQANARAGLPPVD